MSRTYSSELKEQILNEYRNGRSIRALVADYEPHEMTIGSWIQKHQAVLHVGAKSQAEDLKRLRRKIRRLQKDNAILKKAAAWFSSQPDGRATK